MRQAEMNHVAALASAPRRARGLAEPQRPGGPLPGPAKPLRRAGARGASRGGAQACPGQRGVGKEDGAGP